MSVDSSCSSNQLQLSHIIKAGLLCPRASLCNACVHEELLQYTQSLLLQVTAQLKARLQKAEADMQLTHSKQQHMQLQLDTANSQRLTLAEQLESAMGSSGQLEAECKAESEQCMHAKAECAQLKRELQAAVQHQEALQEVIQELQATLATVTDHHCQCSAHTACTAHADSRGGCPTGESPHTTACVSEASPSTVAALQQQVLELRAISAHLDQCQQQAQLREQRKPINRQQLDRDTACMQEGYVDRTCSIHQHHETPVRHSCKPFQAHKLLSRSVCPSPASCSYVHDTIRAHHGLQHSSDSTCWCGRPKRGDTSALSTPVNSRQAAALAAKPTASTFLGSSRPARLLDRLCLTCLVVHLHDLLIEQ